MKSWGARRRWPPEQGEVGGIVCYSSKYYIRRLSE